ncbi:MAG: hypothetical protein A2029_01415 [Chloroflexi bacterium RBG_19FT_COMBO_47_9]|nr:MAG: hypothetical protein A2W25_05045 [candidate division Zixibacteria bacterium RBG_16_53_22]OGO66566.1 MAG: hypothetical protein A2029_01415 [Chloroflexi bacterium RBG_19FT_COMBO_47_9]
MILQSDNPIRMVRELKGAPLSIIMVLSLVSQRVTQEYLERSTGYTDKPVSQALQYLQEVGLADHTQSGWQLVEENAKQLPLALQIDKEVIHEEPQEAQKGEGIQDPEKIKEATKNQTLDVSLSRNNSDSLKLSKLVVDNNLNLNQDSTNLLTLSEKVGKIPTLEEIKKVLDAAEGLFGRPIMGDPRDYADIDRLISWVAQAYRGCYEQGRLKIQNPAGLVYWAFHQGRDKQAEKKYQDMDHVDQYLPESFLRASGEWIFEDVEDETEE